METVFIASDIPVLFTIDEPDKAHHVFKDTHIIFPKKITVLYGEDEDEMIAGSAILRLEEVGLIADFTLVSTMKNIKKAEKMLGKLYPAVEFTVLDAEENVIKSIEITGLFLTPHENDSPYIEPLGDSLIRVLSKEEMH